MATQKPRGRYTKGPFPSDIRNVTYKKLGGEVTIVPVGLAKEILKKAIASALAKRAASGQSSKALIKTVLENKQVQKIQPTQQDVAKELYNFYKRNPKYNTTVKVTKKTPQTKEDIAKAKAIAASQAKKARIEAGISVKKAKPKVTNKGTVTEKQKAAAIARNTETKRQAAIDAREPNVNSAFEELSKRELAMYQEAARRVAQGLKNSGKNMKPDLNLTPAQLKKIKALAAELQRKMRG